LNNKDLNEILEKEVNGRKIFISNGLSAMYILLRAINKAFPEYQISFDPHTNFIPQNSKHNLSNCVKKHYLCQLLTGKKEGG